MPTQPSYSYEDILEAANIEPPDQTDRIYSNEVREIISHKPVWIVRNGIVLFFLIIVCMLSLSFVIQYPDLVKMPVRIMATNLPKQLVSKVEGRLMVLKANNNTTVGVGELLAIMQNDASYTHVAELENWVNRTEKLITEGKWKQLQKLPVLDSLGELQKNYRELTLQLIQANWLQPNGYLDTKQQAIQRDLINIEDLKKNNTEQKKLIQEDLSIQQNLLDINKKLADEKVIAPLDLNTNKVSVIAKKQQLVQSDANTINQQTNTLAKQKELLEIEKSRNEIQQNLYAVLLSTKQAIVEWKTKYLIIATETGKLQFTSYIQENTWVKSGQELFTIIPAQPSYFAELLAPQNNFGKLKQGQTVNIAVNGFQRTEYGFLKGSVDYIPSVPYKDSIFIIKVNLPNSLVTNYNKKLVFTNNLSGTAEVITKEASLADRLLYLWRSLGVR
jgi:multidrug efflux pump subunit AcrA (membrane-fusion protein)